MTWRAFLSRFRSDPRAKAVQAQGQQNAARALAAALGRGTATAVAPLLTEDVEAVVDSGRAVPASTSAARGRAAVSELLGRTLWAAHREPAASEQEVNGAPGIVLRSDGAVVGILSIGMRGTQIAAVWLVVNPDKLGHWDLR